MARAERLHEVSGEYAGTLAARDDVRLIVSARGSVYALQERQGDRWARFRSFPTGYFLLTWLQGVMVDPPADMLAVAERLPDDPRECPLVPFARR